MRSRPLIKRQVVSTTKSSINVSSQKRPGSNTVLPETIHQQQQHNHHANGRSCFNQKNIRKGRACLSINKGQRPVKATIVMVVIVCAIVIITAALMLIISPKGVDHNPGGLHRRNTIKDAIIGRLKPQFYQEQNLQLKYNSHQPNSMIVMPIIKEFDIVLPKRSSTNNMTRYHHNELADTKGKFFPHLKPLGRGRRREQRRRDYGDLQIRFHEDIDRRMDRREIMHDFIYDHGYDDLSPKHQDDDDAQDYYYDFDDDIERNPYKGWVDDKIRYTKHCRRTSWHRDVPIDCNTIHEFDLQSKINTGLAKYLDGGAFRQVFTAQIPSDDSGTTQFVFKKFYYDIKFNYKDFEYMRMDALVAERFTSNPRIVNIYGYCALGMINENMNHNDLEKVAVPGEGRPGHKLPSGRESEPQNNLTAITKLKYALDMVEAVALLHGYSGGVIVHDDIQLSQFLLDSNGNVRLNDFNRAEIMLWNEKDREYCKYRNGVGHGDWRAPQEYLDEPLDEKIDVWSLGNNMYSLLTGLYPMYEIEDTGIVKKRIKERKTGVVDPGWFKKSLPERKLAEIIPLCWEFDPNKRIDVFHLAELLRAAYNESLTPVVRTANVTGKA